MKLTPNESNLYLQRYGSPKVLFSSDPHPDLAMVVVIPCFNEPDLIRSLTALATCDDTECAVEILVIINDSDEHGPEIKLQNRKTCQQVREWAKTNIRHKRQVLVHYESQLPNNQSGVGRARKIGMDEAVRRLEKVKKPRGIIVCFDADSVCDPDYLYAIERYFRKNPKSPGASIYFEHPLDGRLTPVHYQGIIFYELFLRYYVDALRYTWFPHAYQTIGSAMAVRSDIYQKQGGMNKRKAGEDFYFLHKVIPLGNFGEINTTRVIPSPRASDRVPFGTGKAINEWLQGKDNLYRTYNPDIFKDLKTFLSQVGQLFGADASDLSGLYDQWPESVRVFLEKNDFERQLKEINQYCGPTRPAFLKRFYSWFNGFRILKFIHFARDNFYENVEIEEAVRWLMKVYMELANPPLPAKEQLIALRKFDRAGWP